MCRDLFQDSDDDDFDPSWDYPYEEELLARQAAAAAAGTEAPAEEQASCAAAEPEAEPDDGWSRTYVGEHHPGSAPESDAHRAQRAGERGGWSSRGARRGDGREAQSVGAESVGGGREWYRNLPKKFPRRKSPPSRIRRVQDARLFLSHAQVIAIS